MTSEEGPALEPLLRLGYKLVSDTVDQRHFGDRVIVLEKPNVRLRLLRERSEWFADVGAVSNDEQYFDISIVMRAVSGESSAPGIARTSLRTLAEFLAGTAPRWESLFSPERYAETRQKLHSIEVASARERFGYNPE